MRRRKLSYSQIFAVSSNYKNDWTTMRPVPLNVPLVTGQTYSADAKGIYLPKRRRGEKFHIRYTELKDVVL